MKTGFFDRVTLCSSCGAPLQASRTSEPVRCTQCGVENQVVARVDEAVSEGWSEDEQARVAHLRSQDCTYRPDPGVADFVAGMRLSRANSAHAFAAWQHMRTRNAPDAALTELTLLLAWRAAEEADPYRERGLLESALAVVKTPHHTHRLRAALAMLAARMGDVEGAESWLRACDPRAVDVHSDSAYRFARAYIDTAAGNYSRVLVVLGGNGVEIPIVEELAGPCALLRANAWERLGRPSTALELLLHYKFEGNPFGQQIARSFLALSERIDLCPASEPEAERQRQLTLGRRRVPWTAGMVVVLGLGFYFLFSALVLFGFGTASLFSFDAQYAMLHYLFAFILLVPAGLFVALFFPAYRRTKNERALLALGTIAPARCLPGAEAATQGPGAVLVACEVWVAPDREAPFATRITLQTGPERVTEFVSGKPFSVRHLGTDLLIEPTLR